MEVQFLGTGCPQVDPQRFGPATLFRAQRSALQQWQLLFDCGSGVTQRLVQVDTSGANLDAVFLTHLHSDHVVDLFQLILSAWHQGRTRPQLVYGPTGTKAHVDRLLACWRAELDTRVRYEQRSSSTGLEIRVHELDPPPGGVLVVDASAGPLPSDVQVQAVAVNHAPLAENTSALGYLVRCGGVCAVLSGDTAPCRALSSAFRTPDLLIHEVLLPELLAANAHRTAATVEAMCRYHSTPEQLVAVANACGASALVLYHFVPSHFDRAALRTRVAEQFRRGPVLLAEDLLCVGLRRRTTADEERVAVEMTLQYGQLHVSFPLQRTG